MNIVPLFSDTEINRHPARKLWHPTIYFAGRMNGCRKCDDWRDVIGFYGFDDLLGGVDGEVPVEPGTLVQFRHFAYGGPFAIDTASGHASGHADDEGNHERVWANDRFQIARCDLFVGYLEDLEAHGTLVEVGIANALGKPIVLGFSKDLPPADYDELWFARAAASRVHPRVTPREFWDQVQRDWIAKQLSDDRL